MHAEPDAANGIRAPPELAFSYQSLFLRQLSFGLISLKS